MTTTQNNRLDPDWSKIDLPPAYRKDLHRLQNLEIELKMMAAMGQAITGFVAYGEPSDVDLENIDLAWSNLFTNRFY